MMVHHRPREDDVPSCSPVVVEEDDWLVVNPTTPFKEEDDFVAGYYEAEDLCYPPPLNLDGSWSSTSSDRPCEDARTAFLTEAKRNDYFIVDPDMCEVKFDLAAWIASWPVKELVAASTVLVTLKLLTAITNRITPRLL